MSRFGCDGEETRASEDIRSGIRAHPWCFRLVGLPGAEASSVGRPVPPQSGGALQRLSLGFHVQRPRRKGLGTCSFIAARE